MRKVISKRTRFRVLSRSGFRCAYCGALAADGPLEIDHVVPVSKGGSDHESNLVAACCDCNLGKSNDPVDVSQTPRQSSPVLAPSSRNSRRQIIDVSANCLMMLTNGVYYKHEFYEFVEPLS